MRTLSMLRLIVLCSVVGGVGCGNGDSTQGPQEPDDPDEPSTLDFSAVEGRWTGPGTYTASGTSLTLTITLEAGAVRNRSVGTMRVDWPNPADEDCLATLIAESAEPPDYTVSEVFTSGGCVGGVGRMGHGASSGTMSYQSTPPGSSTIQATASLTRDE